MSDEPDLGEIQVSPRVMRELTQIAVRARVHIMREIAEHIGPMPDDTEAASLYCVILAVALGDLVKREPDPTIVTDMANAAWRYGRLPMRLDLNRVQ